MHHELRTNHSYFQATLDGRRSFEIRPNRGFEVGDTVTLVEYSKFRRDLSPQARFTGRALEATITFVSSFAQQEGVVVLSFSDIQQRAYPRPVSGHTSEAR